MNLRQIKAIEKANKQRWLKYDPAIPDKSGIYILTRTDENGIQYAYIGQALHILSRLAQHLRGYQHIDLSLKKHGIYSEDNPYGWCVQWGLYPADELDTREREYIRRYAQTHQLRNKTVGGQDKGKDGLDDNRPAKGYYDGKRQGRRDVIKELKRLSKYVEIEPKKGKLAARMCEKLLELINEEQ